MTRNNANHAKSPNRTLFGLGILHFCRLVWERGKVRRLREPLGKAANCIGCKGGACPLWDRIVYYKTSDKHYFIFFS